MISAPPAAESHRYSSAPPSPRCTAEKAVRPGVSDLLGGVVRASVKPGKRFSETVARESLITPEGLEKLKAELEELQTTRRREVAARIKEAREFGDIAENSEYDDAKNEQAMLEQRIAQMEERVRRATVIDAKDLDTGVVSVGVRVHVKDQKTGDSRKFQLVGSAEANPAEDKLSHESPIGKALMGRKRGEVVSVDVPRGPAKELKITKIEAA